MSRWIDLNADLGEGMGDDEGIMQIVTSCNIACGGHTGDETSMRAALSLAKQCGVAAGAHPSYPDRENFGRRSLDISLSDLDASLTEQVTALKRIASMVGVELTHLKPHGALYNAAAAQPDLANLIARVAASVLPGARLVGPSASEMERAAKDAGLSYIAEGFADRAYSNDGRLVSRDRPGAVLEAGEARIRQALSIAETQTVTSVSGEPVSLPAQTICLHGDTPGALASAQSVRSALEASGFAVRAP